MLPLRINQKRMNIKFLYLTQCILLLNFSLLSSQQMALGGRHSLVLCQDSIVRSFGYNGFGQLGNGNEMEPKSGAILQNLKNVVYIAGGLFHSLFVLRDGTVWSVGRNTTGPLGDGSNANKNIPIKVNNLTNVVKVAGGGEHSLFLKSDGTVWACGNNSSGQLGDGTNQNRNVPVQVLGLTQVIGIAAGAEFSLFLKSDGKVWACGHNGYGQFGTGNRTGGRNPIVIPGLEDIVQISGGEWHSIFVKKDGTVYSAGRNNYGQLGIGNTTDTYTITRIESLSDIVQADGGGIHSVFVRRDGVAFACGLNHQDPNMGNNEGQLGDGTKIDRHSPVMVTNTWGEGKIIYAEATREHSLFLEENGTVWGTGRNNYGQIGTGNFDNNNHLTCVKSIMSCPLISDLNSISLSNSEDVKFCPNPVNDHLTIESILDFNRATITIINVNGKIVKQFKDHSGSSFSFKVGDLLNGMYMLRIKQNNFSYSAKFFKL